MNESTGNAFLYTFVIAFVGIILVLFIGGLSYTKAYKVKNLIVNELENKSENMIVETNINNDGDLSNHLKNVSDVISGVNNTIEESGIGYKRLTAVDNTNMCTKDKYYYSKDGDLLPNTSTRDGYQYCIYLISANGGKRNGYYFKVVTFMYVDLPVLDSLIKVPVVGETETFYTLSS